MFLAPIPHQQLGIHPRSQLPSWELWDPALYAKGLRRSLANPYRVLNIQTSVPVVDPAMDQELTPVPLARGPGAPGEHYLRQLPMNKKSSVKVQECS